LRKEASKLFSPPGWSYRRDTRVVFPDAVGPSGRLGVAEIFDLMERQRTELIGGQAELQRLKAAEGVHIVVYSISMLSLHETAVAPQDEIEVTSGFVLEGDMYYCVHQSVSHVPTGAAISEGYVRLVFAREGAVVKAPESTLQNLAALSERA